MYIGAQLKTILGIIIPNIIQRSITKIFAHSSYIIVTAYMFCEGVLNSRSPSRARARAQTFQRTLRATQVRAALSYAYAVTYQNRITDIL
jgi:hypothetical protein